MESQHEERSSIQRLLDDYTPIYAVKLVRVDDSPSSSISARGRKLPKMSRPQATVELLWQYLKDTDREHFVALLLDIRGGLIGVTTVSVGDLGCTVVHPREVFKPAILANAANILIAHNHPSGDPTPSPEDADITRRLCDAGRLLGIDVIDHVVIGGPQTYVSLREKMAL